MAEVPVVLGDGNDRQNRRITVGDWSCDILIRCDNRCPIAMCPPATLHQSRLALIISNNVLLFTDERSEVTLSIHPPFLAYMTTQLHGIQHTPTRTAVPPPCPSHRHRHIHTHTHTHIHHRLYDNTAFSQRHKHQFTKTTTINLIAGSMKPTKFQCLLFQIYH